MPIDSNFVLPDATNTAYITVVSLLHPLSLCVSVLLTILQDNRRVSRLPGVATLAVLCIHLYACRETLRIFLVVSHLELLLDARAS